VLILLCPFLYFFKKDVRLLRSPTAILVYILVIAFISPQPYGMLNVAIVRYLIPLIPLCVFTGALCILTLTARRRWLGVFLALLAFGTNVLHGGPMSGINRTRLCDRSQPVGFRSTMAVFVEELIFPPPSVYHQTAEWMRENIKHKQTVWVLPDYATYPLMAHAPDPLYAWQLDEPQGQFRDLPDIHFKGKVFPEYLVLFGPYLGEIGHLMKQWEKGGVRYEEIKRIDKYWCQLSRPELYWHAFREMKEYSPQEEAVYIFRKKN